MRCCDAILLLCAATAGGPACVIDDVYLYRDGGVADRPDPVAPAPDSGAARARPELTSAAALFNWLEGSSWTASAPDIPSHPNGYDEDVNFGQATQCLHATTLAVHDRAFSIRTVMGTLRDAPNPGDAGRCDREAASGTELQFDTTAALIEDVRGDGECFDITLTYSGFGQEGRGAVSPDGELLELELYFRDQAIGHRCADGEVGSSSVTLNEDPFTGNAVQSYRKDR